MHLDLVERLLALNREFYARYAGSFSDTRYSVQPGVHRLLPELSQAQSLLDIGCGNGNLAIALQKAGFSGIYLGIDSSPNLLDHAKTTNQTRFATVDLAVSTWASQLVPQSFDAITCFAVLHHLPSSELQSQTFQDIASLLKPNAKLYISVWQPLNSARLRKRILPWETVNLDPHQIYNEHDLLLDWRAENQTDPPAYRYVHQFTSAELDELAQKAAMTKRDEWFSDGREGNLALYQIWQLQKDKNHD
jgi:tRNA (uracil-5-)-methyltransferase TRM9